MKKPENLEWNPYLGYFLKEDNEWTKNYLKTIPQRQYYKDIKTTVEAAGEAAKGTWTGYRDWVDTRNETHRAAVREDLKNISKNIKSTAKRVITSSLQADPGAILADWESRYQKEVAAERKKYGIRTESEKDNDALQASLNQNKVNIEEEDSKRKVNETETSRTKAEDKVDSKGLTDAQRQADAQEQGEKPIEVYITDKGVASRPIDPNELTGKGDIFTLTDKDVNRQKGWTSGFGDWAKDHFSAKNMAKGALGGAADYISYWSRYS